VNPILAIEAGIDQIIRRHPGEFDSKRLGAFKNLGYKIRIKYKFLEFEL